MDCPQCRARRAHEGRFLSLFVLSCSYLQDSVASPVAELLASRPMEEPLTKPCCHVGFRRILISALYALGRGQQRSLCFVCDPVMEVLLFKFLTANKSTDHIVRRRVDSSQHILQISKMGLETVLTRDLAILKLFGRIQYIITPLQDTLARVPGDRIHADLLPPNAHQLQMGLRNPAPARKPPSSFLNSCVFLPVEDATIAAAVKVVGSSTMSADEIVSVEPMGQDQMAPDDLHDLCLHQLWPNVAESQLTDKHFDVAEHYALLVCEKILYNSDRQSVGCIVRFQERIFFAATLRLAVKPEPNFRIRPNAKADYVETLSNGTHISKQMPSAVWVARTEAQLRTSAVRIQPSHLTSQTRSLASSSSAA
jgi:hypothetical protein